MKNVCWLLMVAVCLTGTAGWAQGLPDSPRPDAWVTCGDVSAMVLHGDVLYIGGDFKHIGPNTGAIAPISADTGQANAQFPKVNDIVRACIYDGSGGWYIGGDFTEVGGLPRNRLAHINADGTVSDWNPNANRSVRTLALAQDRSVVYAGGDFNIIGGEVRNCIAAISAATGAPTDWNPGANEPVHVLIIGAEGPDVVIYAGGAFTQIAGENRNRAAKFKDGVIDDWNPNVSGIVRALYLCATDDRVYLGGSFFEVGGEVRWYIGAVEAGDASVTGWDPRVWGPVYALVMHPVEDVIFAGGAFTKVGHGDGSIRRCVAGIRTADASVTAFNPGLVFGGRSTAIKALGLSPDGSLLYVGGDFSMAAGQERCSLAAFDTTGAGALVDWDPVVNAEVLALCLSADGNTVFAGGAFAAVNMHSQRYLAAINVVTGVPTDWDPGVNHRVDALALAPDGDVLYVGGRFSFAGGLEREALAAFHTDTGALTDWEPKVGVLDYIMALAVSPDGTIVYLGGRFGTINEQPRDNIAAVRAVDGQLTDWAPEADDFVYSLVVSPDGTIIYAAGEFNRIGGQDRNYIAALNAGNNNATAWNPDADAGVYAMALSPDGSLVYAGGNFTRMNIMAEDRNGIAALDTVTGIPTAWNPNANHVVDGLTVSSDGALVYAGGRFTEIGGHPRNYIAAINAADGMATTWNPDADCNVYAFALSADDKVLYTGGAFWRMGGVLSGTLAVFSPQHTLTYTAGANGAISGMATQFVYHGCDGAEVTAVPDTGYHFTQWSDLSTANPRRDLNVTDDISVAASFALTLTAPDTPTGVAASAGDHIGEVRLVWTAAARAAGYEIWRALSAAGADMTLQGVSVGTTFTDTDVGPNVNYYYWIRATNAAGDSALSSVAHGFPGVRGPMIMANGQVGNVRVGPGAALSLTARLHKGDLPAVMVDWWVAAYLQNTGEWYYMTLDRTWHPFDVNLRNCLPVAIGPLADLPVTVVAEFGGLPPGSYHIWFVVDYPGDGILHLTPGYHLTANVNIIVE